MLMTIGWLLASFSISLLRGPRRDRLCAPARHAGSAGSAPLAPRADAARRRHGIVVAMLVCLPGVAWSLYPAGPAPGLSGALCAALAPGGAGRLVGRPSFAARVAAAGRPVAGGRRVFRDSAWWRVELVVVAIAAGGRRLDHQPAQFHGRHRWHAGAAGDLRWRWPAALAAAAGQPVLALCGGLPGGVGARVLVLQPSARAHLHGRCRQRRVGLLVFAFSAMLWQVDHVLLWPALILSSAFVIDASLTLLTRMWLGRRWYTAHREHLYQWLARRGGAHAQRRCGLSGLERAGGGTADLVGLESSAQRIRGYHSRLLGRVGRVAVPETSPAATPSEQGLPCHCVSLSASSTRASRSCCTTWS